MIRKIAQPTMNVKGHVRMVIGVQTVRRHVLLIVHRVTRIMSKGEGVLHVRKTQGLVTTVKLVYMDRLVRTHAHLVARTPNITSGNCYACDEGYHGVKCLCSNKCAMCDKLSGNCSLCDDGFYGNACNKKCAQNCLNNACDMLTDDCYQCKPRYFGDKCQYNCSSYCNDGICNTTTGDCNECIHGYHGILCNETCPVNCFNNSCDRYSGECSTCLNGFYGYQCRQNCSTNCNNDTCNKTVGVCNKCIEGYYGAFCNVSCPVNCDAKSCDRDTGECMTCAFNFYGPFCNISCSKNCENQTCDKETGQCSACTPGFYGLLCNQTCADDCYKSVCDQLSATCVECNVGRYGNVCSDKCSSSCIKKACKQNSGICLHGCEANVIGNTCAECVAGKYGHHCNWSCSTFCNNSTCHRENGTCTDSCILSSSDHEYCCVNNTNCFECSSPTMCVSCIEGKYGINCEAECPEVCFGSCEKDSGYCHFCNASKYGDTCQYDCSDTCRVPHNETRSCSKHNGTCIHGCRDFYVGPKCRNICPGMCEGPCEQTTSYCLSCRNNTHGLRCNVSCPEHCVRNDNVSTTCFQSNGSCTYGCDNGYYGNACELNCSSGCNGSCHLLSGKCILGCIVGFTGDYCRRIQDVEDPSSSMVAVSVAVSVVTLCIAVIITGVFIFLRKRKSERTKRNMVLYLNSNNKTQSHPSVKHVYQNTVFAEHLDTAKKDEENTMSRPPSQEQIVISDPTPCGIPNTLRSSTTGHNILETLSKSEDVLKEEFNALPNGLIKSYGDSRRPENISKNRYNTIYPYDETRVKLHDEDSDYINANYIHGYKRNRAYIAALGPTTKTLGDDFHMFWKMVWQEKVEIILMLTKLVEITGMKCDQYWPNQGTTTQYGHFTVSYVSEEDNVEFVVRNLTVSKKSEQRQLRHVHFTAWPDKGVPSDVISINNLRHKVVKIKKMFDGPLLVHCSAGIGRTGTYIALDILTEKGVSYEAIDVFECVNTMRQQRVNMVQTLDQYKYLHHALLWSLTSDIEPIPAERFIDLSWLYEDKKLAELHERLQTGRFYDTEEVLGAIAENKTVPFANRHGADIPGSCNTVFLFKIDDKGFDRAIYINAVFVDGYRKQHRFIAAQTPLHGTVSNFLDMILQENVTCIVDLTPDKIQEDVGEYLPIDDQEIPHSSFVFRVTSREDKTAYTKREVGIYEHDKIAQTIHHFKFNKWGDGEIVPESPEEFLQLVNDVEKLVINNDMGGPIIIHCLTGAVNSGLFCAVWVLKERIETDIRASVLNTLGQIKTRRRMAFQSEEQIAFCFECVAAHLQNLDRHVYSNMVLNK